ncbi:NAD(P)/FAD-dependent oxidoreductase [Sessilibacter corallicola]|uniref:NAD(P)/FAD-dependent oxidoreductase n=1 Tax=Sessilibacter corallicola TaxID=2904075 RepID=UPI001E2FBD24|nr:FAD-binding oxidoreductase [Sessilibacter corallicola]MCE2028892.1 FAD-binding oxidoreductase [Sessilibacter corallicola]
MSLLLRSVSTQDKLPASSTVVIIGGGIVGVSAALTLAERNIPVVLLEKGHIAGEQSSRNLGWVRKTNRHASDVPLAQAADQLWAQMQERVGCDVGYQRRGIMFLSGSEADVAGYETWLQSVKDLDLGSQLLSRKQLDQQAPGCQGNWLGAIYTPSDGVAEPALATSAMASAAIKQGAVFVQHCAVRTLVKSAGRVTGVLTEKGEIRCDQVLLAGGAWSRRFLGNHGISLPTLPLILSVLRTKPINGPTNIATGGPDFSFRKHKDGGYVITQRSALDSPILLDHLLIGRHYMSQLGAFGSALRIRLGRPFIDDLKLARRWKGDDLSPFEKIRTINPNANSAVNIEALANLSKVWPMFENAEIDEAWAGQMDITPDSTPVIDRIESIVGLTVATGFSGHGFGTGPAAGQLAADLVCNNQPLVDPAPYRFNRF